MNGERYIRREYPGVRFWSDGTIEKVPLAKMADTCRLTDAIFAHNYAGFGDRPPPKHVVGKQNIAELEAAIAKLQPTKRPMDEETNGRYIRVTPDTPWRGVAINGHKLPPPMEWKSCDCQACVKK